MLFLSPEQIEFAASSNRVLQKVSIKDKDGRIDALRTSRIKKDLVMKTAGHIYFANGMGADGLEAVEKAFKKPLSSSPGAHVGGYTHKNINEYLEKEFGAKLEETSEKKEKRRAGFYQQENYKEKSNPTGNNRKEENEEEDEEEYEEEDKKEQEKNKESDNEKKENEEESNAEESKEEK